jgi:arylsulfatase
VSIGDRDEIRYREPPSGANNVILPSRSPFESLQDAMPQRVAEDPGYPPLINKRQFVPPPDMVREPKK